jgi:protein TonB
VVDARGCAKPEYPPAALRAQETGTVALSFLIDVDGKVLEGKVERSSGSRRLDEAARKGLALCKFKPATLDGKPEQSWSRIEYEWKIE